MEKIVLYFGGGTMRGVFGAGVATAFQENNLYPNVGVVYTASAGVMTGAYFLARQTRIGASIYWQNLQKEFISYKNFTLGLWDRFQNRFLKHFPQNKIHDALAIERLMSVIEKGKKRLDVTTLIAQNIPLYVKLFNLDSRLIEFVDARRPDVFNILKAGVNVFPYVHKISIIDGKRYIDAAIMDIVGIGSLRQRHPNEKIIIVLNGQLDRKLRYRMKNIIEGKYMQWMFDDPTFFSLYASAEDRLYQDLETLRRDPACLLITPQKDFSVRSRTTKPNMLYRTYQHGIEAGESIFCSSFMKE